MPTAPEGRFVPARQDDLARSGARARFQANVAALHILRELQDQDRAATAQERAVPARWGSWGATGVAEVFDEGRPENTADRTPINESTPSEDE